MKEGIWFRIHLNQVAKFKNRMIGAALKRWSEGP
jgi:hypothetical protein